MRDMPQGYEHMTRDIHDMCRTDGTSGGSYTCTSQPTYHATHSQKVCRALCAHPVRGPHRVEHTQTGSHGTQGGS